MDKSILGKWTQNAEGPFPGLSFTFHADGSFNAEYAPMAILSAGTFSAQDGLIDMQQTEHSFGMIGLFHGRYAVEDDRLLLNMAALGEPEAPADLENAITYLKEGA